MKRALLLLRDGPAYRRDRFAAGLDAAGYQVCLAVSDPHPGDVAVAWNRYGAGDAECRRFEKAGAAVLVAENGYLAGAVDGKWHALARSYHNDQTVVPDGGLERWNALNVALQPWRASGEHVLVCPNRSFGTPGRIMPVDWGRDVCARLAKMTKREIRLRPHPGNKPPEKPLADDLIGAWCTVIWSSSAGVHSLIAGVPVICESPYWICKLAARLHGSSDIEADEVTKDVRRLSAMQRLAWAVWSVDEISSGDAFRRLLQ